MKTQRTTTIIALATTLTWGSGPAQAHGGRSSTPKVSLDIYVQPGSLSPLHLGHAQLLAAGVFENIGVHLIWHWGRPHAVFGAQEPRDKASLIIIHTIPRAPTSASLDGLAGARQYGSEITLYQDRIERFFGEHYADRSILLAYILAHELAHVIEGMDRHSDSGILKAHWTGADYTAMRFRTLAFAEEDVRLIRLGAAARSGQAETQIAGSAAQP